MSHCTSTLRAVSRTRPVQTSIASFLYQTATIQHSRPVSSRAHIEKPTTRPRREESIPFVDSANDAALAAIPSRPSTITGPERAAFRTLYERLGRDSHRQSSHEVPFVSHEEKQFEDDVDDEDASLDALLDSVMAGRPPAQSPPARRRESLKTLAEDMLKMDRDRSKHHQAAEDVKIRNAGLVERERIMALMEEARTDRELWAVLNAEVLKQVQSFKLDDPEASQLWSDTQRKSTARRAGKKGKNTTPTDQLASSTATPASTTLAPTPASIDQNSDWRILFHNYPILVLHAATLLRAHFPSSNLPLLILPTLKSLGLSSYALGATTRLYNVVIRTAWLQYSSYTHVDELLTEMENGGIAFNRDTLELLDLILRETRESRQGVHGNLAKRFSNMQQSYSSSKKLQDWRMVIYQRLEALGISKPKRKMGSSSVRIHKLTLHPHNIVRKTEIAGPHIVYPHADVVSDGPPGRKLGDSG
ncbi:hypothetical protein EJ04DRAFT_517380 [Polyplosphaeria fusca]|uniref:Mtf2-like C-terminal domain-containing protein n=1 Tax=Polyplosphaeria fusca TaxID=682080 RepID=A0A9P4QKP7_9PLEO|nr:hypothetical protein EJ04DRAFT_517380 [Polyplosphaeria fusca]